MPAASANPGVPMRLVTMKKWPRQPWRSSVSPIYGALAPPSSNVSMMCLLGASHTTSVTSDGNTVTDAIAQRWSSNARRLSLYGHAPGRWKPENYRGGARRGDTVAAMPAPAHHAGQESPAVAEVHERKDQRARERRADAEARHEPHGSR